METQRRCPECGKPSVCMKALSIEHRFLCRECWHPIRVNRIWLYGFPLGMALTTFLLFQFKYVMAGAVLFFPTLMLIAGGRLFAVRWFPLTAFIDPALPPGESRKTKEM